MDITIPLVLYMVSFVSGDSELSTFLYIREHINTKVTFKLSIHVTFPDHARSAEYFALRIYSKTKLFKMHRADLHFLHCL